MAVQNERQQKYFLYRSRRLSLRAALVLALVVTSRYDGSATEPCSCKEECTDTLAGFAPDLATVALTISDTTTGPVGMRVTPTAPQITRQAAQLAARIRSFVPPRDLIAIQEVFGQGLSVTIKRSALDTLRHQLALQTADSPEPRVSLTIDHRLRELQTKVDPWLGEQWSLSNRGLGACEVGVDVGANVAWTHAIGVETPVVAVVESGLVLHPDMLGMMWTNEGEQGHAALGDHDDNGYPNDVHGFDVLTKLGVTEATVTNAKIEQSVSHGTMVSSIIGARVANGLAMAGLAQPAKIVLCRYYGNSSELIACLRYIRQLKVKNKVPLVAVNLSWGEYACNCDVEREIRLLQAEGVLFVASAGNEGLSNDAQSGMTCPLYPASHDVPNVISVASSDCTGKLASNSNYGARSVHLAAPGVGIPSIDDMSSKYIRFMDGTSASAPHVTATIALLKRQDPTRDWRALRNLVLAGGLDSPEMKDTISRRRLLIAGTGKSGSLTCQDQIVQRRLLPSSDSPVTLSKGCVLTVAAMSIKCASPASGTSVKVDVAPTARAAFTFELKDDGVGPDQAAGDGVYAGSFSGDVADTYKLRFSWADAKRSTEDELEITVQ